MTIAIYNANEFTYDVVDLETGEVIDSFDDVFMAREYSTALNQE